VLLGITPPEVIPLRKGIVCVGERDAQDILHDGAVFERGGAQLSPILTLAALDHIVDRGQDVTDPAIQMPMQHSLSLPKRQPRAPPNKENIS
jgi:hypothetical protein